MVSMMKMLVIVGSCMWIIFMLLSIFVSGEVTADSNHSLSPAATSRLLTDTGDADASEKGQEDNVSLEDYRPYDPSPSSKAKVKPAPIQHGTPLMPYIPNPRPSPPSQSDSDRSYNGSEDGSPSPPSQSDSDGSYDGSEDGSENGSDR